MGTDVTEFKLSFGKAYLAPVYDFGSKEIVAHSISESPDLAQQEEMLEKLMEAKPDGARPILHSDMGWQYQHASYVSALAGERVHPEHVAQGQLHRQRRHRAGLRPRMKDEFFRGATGTTSRRSRPTSRPTSSTGTRGGARSS